MTEFLSFWSQQGLTFSEKFFFIALTLNIVLTSALIIQNIFNHRNPQAPKGVDKLNKSFAAEYELTPLPSYPNTQVQQRPETNIEKSRLGRAIKMIRQGYSQQDVENSLDIEATYIKILFKYHKSNKN